MDTQEPGAITRTRRPWKFASIASRPEANIRAKLVQLADKLGRERGCRFPAIDALTIAVDEALAKRAEP